MQYLLIIILILGVISWLLPYAGYITGVVGIISIIVALLTQVQWKKKYPTEEALKDACDKIANVDAQCERQKQGMARELHEHEKQLHDIQTEIDTLSNESISAYTQIYVDTSLLSEEYKTQLSMVRVKQNELVKSGEAATSPGATGKSKRTETNNIKQLIRCFNAECEIIIAAVTSKNIDTLRTKIQRSYEQLNKIFETDYIAISHKFFELKQQELVLAHSFEVCRVQEREEQKAIREQMLEEERVRKEIEREKAKIEKEETQFKSEIDKLMKYIQKASDIEKQLYVDKIHELEEKLKLLEKDKENVFQREQNTRAGFVYVISNIGAFGEDVFKIGMTRRLEPLDRVKELGDASVPFEFDVHAMIFSEDAPALETTLHQTFKEYQVNKVNPRKEFFRVPLSEVEQVVKSNHNATVTFTQVALATEYRESLRLSQDVVVV